MSKNQTDRVWKALADPTRRAILELLSSRERTTGEVIDRFEDLSRSAVMKHLGILEDARLVVIHREGRLRWNRFDRAPLENVCAPWLERYLDAQERRFARLKDHAERASRRDRKS